MQPVTLSPPVFVVIHFTHVPAEHNSPYLFLWRRVLPVVADGKEWIAWIVLMELNWNGKSNPCWISLPAPVFILMSSSSLLSDLSGDRRLNTIMNSPSRYKNTNVAQEGQKLREKNKNSLSGRMTSVRHDAFWRDGRWGKSDLSLHRLKSSLVITTKSDSHLHGFYYYVSVFMSVLSLCYSLYEKILYRYWLGCYTEIY